MRRIPALVSTSTIVVVAALGLAGCGSDTPERSSGRQVDRRAGGANVAMCVGDRPWDRIDGGTVAFGYSEEVNGPGPFPLEGNWCDETTGDFFYADVVQNGRELFSVGSKNFLGVTARITCNGDNESWVRLNVGQRHPFTCNGFTIDAVREPDTGGVPQFQFWVRTT